MFSIIGSETGGTLNMPGGLTDFNVRKGKRLRPTRSTTLPDLCRNACDICPPCPLTTIACTPPAGIRRGRERGLIRNFFSGLRLPLDVIEPVNPLTVVLIEPVNPGTAT